MRGLLRSVPSSIPRPDYSGISSCAVPSSRGFPSLLTSPSDISSLAESCRIAAHIRQYALQLVSPGISTDEIDRALHDKIVSFNAYPSALGYAGFPKSVVTSVNEIMVHGIPDQKTVLRDGDIVSIDVVVYKDGFHGDCCGNFLVGDVDQHAQRLVQASNIATKRAIEICAPGVPIKEIGNVICDLADQEGFGVDYMFCGHGVGRLLHCAPLIMHTRNKVETRMVEGLVFTIEPVLVEGSPESIAMKDGWAYATKDGKRAAQHEETIIITKNGAEILTVC